MNMEVINSPNLNLPQVFSALMQKDVTERSWEEQEALDLHYRLMNDRAVVTAGIVSMCYDLKEIRDGKYYATLGFDDFGEYTEQIHGIGARQAYNYIRVYEKLGGEFLNLNSKIGVTKLLELASLDAEERQEFLAVHPVEELEDMSTAEVKRLTEQVRKLEDQISFFEQQKSEQSDNQEKLRAEINSDLRKEYDERIAEIQKREKAAAIRAEASVVKDLENQLKQAKLDIKANADAVKAAEERAKVAEEKAAQANEFEFKFKNSESEKAELEKQIRLSSDPELTRFKYIFETWQYATSELFEQLEKLDADMQEKMRGAIKAVAGKRI